MPVVSKSLDPAQWRQSGLRMDPRVKKMLKARAALVGETMEDTLHRILTRELGLSGPADEDDGRGAMK